MASPVSIALVPVPAPPTVSVAQDFNQLMQNIAAYMAASVATSGQFFSEGPTDPTSDVGLFFNTAQEVWKFWSSTTGSYIAVGFLTVTADPSTNQGFIFNSTTSQFKTWTGIAYTPLTEFIAGDEKLSYIAGDELPGGWFVQDGRAISSIVGATTEQKTALNALFPSGNLPVGTQNFPPNPQLGDTRWSPNQMDQLSIGWIRANGQTVAGYPGATAEQITNMTTLYGSIVNFIPVYSPGTAAGQAQGIPPNFGDVKQSYVSGDDPNNGWFVLNGRTISGITTMTPLQQTNATTVSGATTLPTVAATGSPSRFSLMYVGCPCINDPETLYPQVYVGPPAANPAQYWKVFSCYQTTA